jgi:DNA replication and repair protein RecF
MNIKSLDLKNYRNYGELHLTLDEHTNLFYGDNAQGKTNILEAVYMCAMGRSHRSSKDRELISFGEDESHIKLKMERRQMPYVIDIHLKKNRPKGVAINGAAIKRLSELFGILNVVCFSPEDLNIINNGPDVRRRFVDMELCQLSSLYVHSLVNYNKALEQKNKLLKEIDSHRDWKDTLDIWDMQLEKFGSEVISYRRSFIADINKILKKVHSELTGGRENLGIVYEANAVRNLRDEELYRRTTLSGPHRDDLGIYDGDIDLRKYGSQGQKRTAALSLKLAEIELVEKKAGDQPVLLLDDVLSELDGDRQKHLLGAVSRIQTIITCTGTEGYISGGLEVDKIFYVKEGTVECE